MYDVLISGFYEGDTEPIISIIVKFLDTAERLRLCLKDPYIIEYVEPMVNPFRKLIHPFDCVVVNKSTSEVLGHFICEANCERGTGGKLWKFNYLRNLLNDQYTLNYEG